MNPLTWRIAISILKVPYISLANLILNRLIFKELLQERCTAEALAEELERLTSDKAYRKQMEQDYGRVRAALGTPGSAIRIAYAIIQKATR